MFNKNSTLSPDNDMCFVVFIRYLLKIWPDFDILGAVIHMSPLKNEAKKN